MPRILQLVLAISLGLALTAHATAGDKAKGKGKGKHGIAGVVQSVDKDSVTVKIMQHKKKKGSGSGSGSASGAEEKTFKLSGSTKFDTLSHTKGQKGVETKDAKLEDVKAGQRIRITADGDTAQKIDILGEAKKKKNKNG